MSITFLSSPLLPSSSILRKRQRVPTCNIQPPDRQPPPSSNDDLPWSLLHSRISSLRDQEVWRDRTLAHNWAKGSYKPSVVASIPSDYVRKLSFEGDFLAFGTATGSVVFSDLITGMRLVSLHAHTGTVTALDYRMSKIATAGASDHTICVWNCEPFEDRKYWSTRYNAGSLQEDLTDPCMQLKGHDDIITAVRIDPDRNWLYSASVDGTVRVWNLRNKQLVHMIRIGEPIFTMTLTRKGYLLLGCASGRVQAYQAEKGLHLLSILCHATHTTALDFWEETQTLVAGDSSGNIGLWSFRDSKKLGMLPKHDAAVMSVQIDNTKVVSAGRDGCVAISNINDLKRTYSIHGFTKYLAVAAFDRTRLIADGTNDVIVCHRFDVDFEKRSSS